ncbi:hypothetical protein Acr_26g0000400 [Actinidia rufa]|uniref:Uncharacterized protein n=1 Tax=Actinidia rufa TaxID=165716 RepID=A0A7J0H0Y1_9ERIC|nr:hypothetical protein Acr_26g0000400 [Actinidia rufa]
MEHEVGDLKGRLGEPRGNMLATVNSMELIARIKEYEERQQLKEELTISEPKDDSTSTKVERSKEIIEVLEYFKDLVSPELPKSLPPKGEVDHSTELEEGAKILAMAPYHMATPELPKSLPPKREVDHSIGLELNAKIPVVITTKSAGAFKFSKRQHEDNLWIFPETVSIFRKKRRRGRRQIWWGECHGLPNGIGDDEGVTKIGGEECHGPPNGRRF